MSYWGARPSESATPQERLAFWRGLVMAQCSAIDDLEDYDALSDLKDTLWQLLPEVEAACDAVRRRRPAADLQAFVTAVEDAEVDDSGTRVVGASASEVRRLHERLMKALDK